MMSKTHCVLGVAACSLILSTADPLTLTLAGASTQLPDTDTTKSLAGRVLFPLARFLERRVAHRTLTHSFLATGIVALLAIPLLGIETKLYWAVLIGYLAGWLSDCFTKSGVAAFYPLSSARLVIPANPRLRLATGSATEWFLLLVFIGGVALSIHIHSVGGLLQVFNNLLAQTSSVSKLWEKESADKRVMADIVGRHTNGTRINASFVVVEAHGDEMIVRDEAGNLFIAGNSPQAHIRVDNAYSRVGAPVARTQQELSLSNEDAAARINSLSLPLGGLVYVSGELTLREATELNIPQSMEKLNTITLSGESENKVARLRLASVADVQKLAGYEATGTLIVQTVTLR